MPPKDLQPHTLMFSTDGGETMEPLGEINEVDMSETYIEGEYGQEMVVPAGSIPWGMIEFIAPCIDRRTLLSILAGRKITNNWLKMHGMPMERNAWRKRRCNDHRSRQSPKGRQARY